MNFLLLVAILTAAVVLAFILAFASGNFPAVEDMIKFIHIKEGGL